MNKIIALVIVTGAVVFLSTTVRPIDLLSFVVGGFSIFMYLMLTDQIK